MNDLTIHHKLKNKVEKLEAELKKSERNRINAVKQKDLVRTKGLRSEKAKILLEVRQLGDLDWSIEKIAEYCWLSLATVKNYDSDLKKAKK